MENGDTEYDVLDGVASIALLPSGSISGHFVCLPHSTCYGLQGTELQCERECSRGEDYRLIKLTIIDYTMKRERDVVVECKGHDAARFHNVDHVHGNIYLISLIITPCKDGFFLSPGWSLGFYFFFTFLIHSWEKDVVNIVNQEKGKSKICVSFDCETLKAEKAAEDHIKQFMPKLAGLDAVVNIGRMVIQGLNSESEASDGGKWST